MAGRRRKPERLSRELTIGLILSWVDADHAQTGRWPKQCSGPVRSGPAGENWKRIDSALRLGLRGLPGGSSLAKLLAAKRGVRNRKELPPFSEAQIVRWARSHRLSSGVWPTQDSGSIKEAPGEKWKEVNSALRDGRRGLSGGSSVAQLLAAKVGKRNRAALPRYTIRGILAWCDAHFKRSGEWPRHDSGAIADAPGETWGAIESALQRGTRGLAGGSSLAQLLTEHRGVRNKARLAPLTRELILRWCDGFFERKGHWPTQTSGPILECPGEIWSAVNHALLDGLRGLPGGCTLARLLAEERGLRNRADPPKLSIREIRNWAREYQVRVGRWPTSQSGPIPEAPGETWAGVDSALRSGRRGLKGGLTLSRLFGRKRKTD